MRDAAAYQLSAFVALVFAVHFALIGARHRRQRHFIWLALGAVPTAVQWLLQAHVPVDGPVYHLGNLAAPLLALGGMYATWFGLLKHLSLPRDLEKCVASFLYLPQWLYTATALLLLLNGVTIDKASATACCYSGYLVIGGAAIYSAQRQPREGILAIGALSVAIAIVVAIALWAGWAEPSSGRRLAFYTIGPILALLVTVLHASHLRESRRLLVEIEAREASQLAMKEVNQSLDQRIRNRTVELSAALAQARSVGEAKSRFLAMVSHEVRTPLNGLWGTLEFLKETPLSHDQAALVRSSRTSARQLRALLDDVLDLAKIEAGKLEVDDIEFSLQDLIDANTEGFAHLARRKRLEFSVRWHTQQVALRGDPNRIGQVLRNLLDNALKFTDRGSVCVEVATAVDPTDSGWHLLSIAVIDTGLGIDHDRQELIFDSFSQADTSISRQFGGTGLGLSLCKELCKRMGGDVTVRSEPGRGSHFTMWVRCATASLPPVFTETQPMLWDNFDELRGKSALIVDDNRINLTVMRRILTSVEMKVEEVTSGRAAIERVSERAFDVVLMDVSMPVLNGRDATRAIRASAENTSKESGQRLRALPIIGVTAMAMRGDREACLASGMTDYVSKPIDRHELLTKIADAIHVRTIQAARA